MAPQVCILIVDDDISILQLIEDVLAAEYEVEAISDPFEALDRVQHEHYDLLLIDLGMPQLDGIELIRRLRAQPDTRELPIIALSAFDQLRQRVSNVQVDAVVPKPFSLQALEQTISRLIQEHRQMIHGA